MWIINVHIVRGNLSYAFLSPRNKCQKFPGNLQPLPNKNNSIAYAVLYV